MNRTEALRILGLDEDASPEDIKVAYRETAQILHPDRFAGNKKLQERATEQFKNLQEAYELLSKGTGSHASPSGSPPRAAASSAEARLAGIAAARVALVRQRDVVLDERRNGLAMAGIGALVALIAGRRPVGLFGAVAALAGAVAVWGIVQVVSSQSSLGTLNEHLSQLKAEEKRIAHEVEN